MTLSGCVVERGFLLSVHNPDKLVLRVLFEVVSERFDVSFDACDEKWVKLVSGDLSNLEQEFRPLRDFQCIKQHKRAIICRLKSFK